MHGAGSAERLAQHKTLAAELGRASDTQLQALVEAATPAHVGVGARAVRVALAGRPVFVKLVPLAALEMQPGHRRSTANLFQLPGYFQYGIGSVGFGAWRELAAHQRATQWVKDQASTDFPLLHHWRVLPGLNLGRVSDEGDTYFARGLADLPGAARIRSRFESTRAPAAHLALFVEWFPQHLLDWLRGELLIGGDRAARSIQFVERGLARMHAFMGREGFVHFDAHFENIVTDGQSMCLSDFGLASCTGFALDAQESNFLSAHRDYDRCRSALALVHCIASTFGDGGPWASQLADPTFLARVDACSRVVRELLDRYSPVALALREFSLLLLNDSKLTPYPVKRLAELLPPRGEG